MTASPEESLKFWEEDAGRQIERAKLALGVLALIHNFDREDLVLITSMLADPEPKLPRRDLEAKLGEEAGISFRLTPEQWCAISIELKKEKPK